MLRRYRSKETEFQALNKQKDLCVVTCMKTDDRIVRRSGRGEEPGCAGHGRYQAALPQARQGALLRPQDVAQGLLGQREDEVALHSGEDEVDLGPGARIGTARPQAQNGHEGKRFTPQHKPPSSRYDSSELVVKFRNPTIQSH